jgi:hypothetical protein
LAHAPATASRITANTTKAAAASATRTALPSPGRSTARLIPLMAGKPRASLRYSAW